jgi:Polyketide cyclase / dehydrase and lipid transport
MSAVAVTQRIQVSAQAAWSIIRTGSGLERWLPPITSCRLEGSGINAKRVCILNDGTAEHELLETILTVDDDARLFQYSIDRQSMMPMRNVRGTMHVTEVSSNECEILWFANFDLDDANVLSAIKAGLEGLYRAGISGVEAAAKAS